jgi:predicted GIY-YIG superfamily endonuclease
MNTTNIYILKLEKGKYYIGKTHNVDKRFQQHLNGDGSFWTTKYKPLSVEDVIHNVSSFDEDKYVKQYMAKYGIDNVRGGSYVIEEIDITTKNTLQKEIWAALDCCTKCGRKNHFIKDCYASKDINGNDIKINDENKTFQPNNLTEVLINAVKDITAITIKKMLDKNKEDKKQNLYKCKYCKKEFDSQKGTTYHENFYCKKKKEENTDKCFRCGRKGHFKSECYAQTDVNGNKLD